MFVDLSSINNSDYKLEYQEKSKILLDYLGEPDGKFLIVPIHILNILQENNEFVSCEINSDISGVEKVGILFRHIPCLLFLLSHQEDYKQFRK